MNSHGRLVRIVGSAVFLASIVAIGALTLRPGATPSDLAPFCLVCGTQGGVDATLNVALFVPLGVSLALLGVAPRAAITGLTAGSLAIELLQFAVIAGRNPSIGDWITNSLGGLLGFGIGRYWGWIFQPRPEFARTLLRAWLGGWLCIQVVIGYSLIPQIPDPPLFGELAHAYAPPVPRFPGRVQLATVGSLVLADTQISEPARLRSLLESRSGANVVADVIPHDIPLRRVAILRISGAENMDVLSFEQDGPLFVFQLRTGAEVLRLRPFVFRLADVFRETDRPADSLSLRAKYSRSAVTLGAVTGGRSVEGIFGLRTSLGWRLLTPTQTYVEGSPREWLWGAAFIAILVLPAGYLNSRYTTGKSRGLALRNWLFVAAVVALGLVAIPIAFGLSLPSLPEFAGTVIGLGSGGFLSRF